MALAVNSRLPEGRSPWSTCLGPKQLHTPQNSKWECTIPKQSQRLQIDVGRLPVMANSTNPVRIQMHPHECASMHNWNRPQNSRSECRNTLPTLLGRAICCCTAEKLRFRLKMPDLLMECSKIRFEVHNHNPALFGRDARLNLRRVGASARPQPLPSSETT